jgi:transposase
LVWESWTIAVMVRSGVLSDSAWSRLEPLLPSSDGHRGGRWRSHRQVIEAVAWRFRTGSPWRDLPAQFGPWQTAWKRLDRWSRDGTWEWLLRELQADADAAGELDWVISVDSTVVRAHQHAAAAPRRRGAHGGRDRMTTRPNPMIMVWVDLGVGSVARSTSPSTATADRCRWC